MNTNKLIPYKRMPIWTQVTTPQTVTRQHNTKAGTWGKIRILKGALRFHFLDLNGEILESHLWKAGDAIPFVEPQKWHRVEVASDSLEWYLEFYCRPEDYFVKKYNCGAVHSEILEALPIIQAHTVLDLGCGSGRNSLYLAHQGLEVTAVDKDGQALNNIQAIADEENIPLNLERYDIHEASIEKSYDWILSTVVLMFLDASRIPDIIQNMQDQTKPGGYNLIVCAMDTERHPCPIAFPFTFKEGELAHYYNDWELIKYNENLGHLHKEDSQGNPIQLQFATMLARKPS
ncbi:SAM-dependent methyltransferase TehB [Streptococcus sp. NLN64]|uniref:SAM-dependent methyltransferase TehB n=1 Tax=Streptococcus sp. NLN64 TaxID=2822799 RepID=UPI0018C9F86C|nr:SAM-dependent methyltransferase TehB [Streptococcus sp. NLN64]MBG9368212.1 SAM-dependent methyltransferase TehB [Streptococcus sp. NLN64]